MFIFLIKFNGTRAQLNMIRKVITDQPNRGADISFTKISDPDPDQGQCQGHLSMISGLNKGTVSPDTGF